MSIGFGLLLLFIAVTVQSKMRGVPAHRIALVILTTVACPLAASMSAFGLLIWLGNPIYTIMCVTPFLIAGVGKRNRHLKDFNLFYLKSKFIFQGNLKFFSKIYFR